MFKLVFGGPTTTRDSSVPSSSEAAVSGGKKSGAQDIPESVAPHGADSLPDHNLHVKISVGTSSHPRGGATSHRCPQKPSHAPLAPPPPSSMLFATQPLPRTQSPAGVQRRRSLEHDRGSGSPKTLVRPRSYSGGSMDIRGVDAVVRGHEERLSRTESLEEDEDEEGEAFDPLKAHERFIVDVLRGSPCAGEEIVLASDPNEQTWPARRLRWADEHGEELQEVQYFDQHAEPSTVLRGMLAADARADGTAAPGKAATGREEIVRSFEPLLAEIQGNVEQVEPVKMFSTGETRTVVVAGKGPLRTRVGVAIVWMGGLVQHLRMVRNPEPEFLREPEPLPRPPPFAGPPTIYSAYIPASESEVYHLSPPYIIRRPVEFPTPRIHVAIISATGLKSSTALPRPVNPYVKIRLDTRELRTQVLPNTKNPYWGGEDDQSRFSFDAPDPNGIVYITVGDWKIGRNSWIARLVLPLASIEVSPCDGSEGEEREMDLRCRVSRFAKHIEKEGATTAKLRLRIKYEHPERWWVVQELKARDEARQREEELYAQTGNITAPSPGACNTM